MFRLKIDVDFKPDKLPDNFPPPPPLKDWIK